MADLTNCYSPNDAEGGFDAIPSGKYLATITASEWKAAKSGRGEYLELTLTIQDGPFKGRKLWDRLNLKHENATTANIARGQFAGIRKATGIIEPRDTTQLHDIAIVVTVAQEKRSDTGDMTNTIKKYERRGAAPVAPARAETVAEPATTPDWAS